MSTSPAFAVGTTDAHWFTRNDDVMGGHSRSRVEVQGGLLRFSGTTSLEDNGGFASIRARGAFALRDATAMRLRVGGDGRVYQLRLSTDARYRDSRVSWRGEFDTRAGEWIEATVVFADMVPTWRGTVLDGPALDLSKVEEVGLLIADGQAGDFLLQVDWINPQKPAGDD